MGEPLPPHLSPFISEERRVGDYVPPEEKEMLGLNAKKDILEQEKEPEESEEEVEVFFFENKPKLLSAIKARVKHFNTLRNKTHNSFNETNVSFC